MAEIPRIITRNKNQIELNINNSITTSIGYSFKNMVNYDSFLSGLVFPNINETDGNTKPANIESYYKGFDFKDFKDGKSYWQINLKHIVSIKVKDTRLARKMYPDFKEDEDGYLMIMG